MTHALSELLDDPTLPELAEAIRGRLKMERRNRDRFFDEMSAHVKAEFINGQVIMHSPATVAHAQARRRLTSLINAFIHPRQLGLVLDEKALCVFPRNAYEPDVVFFGVAKAREIEGGTMKLPVPDFVCEILSPSTRKRDRGVKFHDYEAHYVAEYWLFDPLTQKLEQFVLQHGKFELLLETTAGEVTSTSIPGFRIPILALTDEGEHLRVHAHAGQVN